MKTLTFVLKPEAVRLSARYVGNQLVPTFGLSDVAQAWMAVNAQFPDEEWYTLTAQPATTTDGVGSADVEVVFSTDDSDEANFEDGILFRFMFGIN